MKYTTNNRSIVIPDSEISNFMKKLDLTKEEAIEMWLTDHDYEEDEEQEELDKKAKKVKINHGAKAETATTKEKKTRKAKISDEKHELYTFLLEKLQEKCGNVEILTENKLLSVKIGEKSFKVDIIETREKKRK